MSRILRVSSRTLTSSEVQPSPTWWPTNGTTLSANGAGKGDSPSSSSMSRRTSPGRVPSSRWPVHDVELVVQAGHAGAAQARGGLEGRDDEPGELPGAVQHGERVDHRHDRGTGVGDDAARPVGDLARVDLGHDERHVGLGAELGAVVDRDDAAGGRQLDPLARDRRRDVEDGDVDAVEELGRQGLDDDVLAADPQRRPDVLDTGGQAHPAPVRVARRQHVEHDAADGTRDPHDARGSAARAPWSPPRWQSRQRPVPP